VRRGFTLLEVMVAVAILGLGLTAILSAQAGAVSSTSHTRQMSLVLGLGRCRMSEIEQQLARDGFQEMDVTESGVCCGEEEVPRVTCSWKIEKPQFPEPSYGELDLDTDLEGTGELGPLGKLADAEKSGDKLIEPESGVKDVAEVLSGGSADGALADVAAGGIGGVAAMVMNLVYPDLKSLFETASRRVTVTTTWTEGSRSYDVTLVQWITDPRQAGIVGELPEGAEGADGTGLTGPAGTGSGKTTPTRPGPALTAPNSFKGGPTR
jgi:general secretion pathway protein I